MNSVQFFKQPDLSPVVGKLIAEGYTEVPFKMETYFTGKVVSLVAKSYRNKGYSAIKAGAFRLFIKAKGGIKQ